MASPALSESLTERLSHLKPQAPAGLVIRARSAAAATPAPDRLRARRQRRLRNRLLLTGVALAVIVANGAAAYFLPSYAIALGKIPGAGTLLGWSGLSASDVSILYATTQHNSVGLTVTAGFAGDERHRPDHRGLRPACDPRYIQHGVAHRSVWSRLPGDHQWRQCCEPSRWRNARRFDLRSAHRCCGVCGSAAHPSRR